MLVRITVTLFSLAYGLAAQTTCEVPAELLTSTETNIFAGAREADLGDAMAEAYRQKIQPIDDPALTAYIAAIGDRITSHLGPNSGYHFAVVDMSYPQAFSIAGGRIYVSRKLIAIAQSEDELAGVLGHELGHIVTHQIAIALSRELRVMLGVTEVHDRNEVFAKYHELLESYAKYPERAAKLKEEKDQLVADKVGIYATAAAGYDPDALPRIFDRIAGLNGKTGTFLSNFFNTTGPDSKRLRDLLREVPHIAASCHAEAGKHSEAEFERWKLAVAAYDASKRNESIPGLISKITLDPQLRSELKALRFSPDGNYILARDRGGVSVLSHNPFQFLFRIDTSDVKTALFDPQSKNIVVETNALQVESWSLTDRTRNWRKELVAGGGCRKSALASDGKTLACLGADHVLTLFDVATGDKIYSQKDVGFTYNSVYQGMADAATANSENTTYSVRSGYVPVYLDFSPDATRFLAVAQNPETAPLLFDVTQRQKLPLSGKVKKVLADGFVFLDSNRLLAFNGKKPSESSIVGFPSLDPLGNIELIRASFEPATKGPYLMMRPYQDYAVAVINVEEHKLFRGSKGEAFDLYGDEFVAERVSGEIGLYDNKTGHIESTANVPAGYLGPLNVARISDDVGWLAVSNDARGGLWDASTGKSIFSGGGFSNGYFRPDDSLIIDIPKVAASSSTKETARHMALINPVSQQYQNGPDVKGAFTFQRGPYLLSYQPQHGENLQFNDEEGYMDAFVELTDAMASKPLWKRAFEEAPGFAFTGDYSQILLSWPALTHSGQAEIKADSDLKTKWNAIMQKKTAMIYVAIDAISGHSKSRTLVDTGNASFVPQNARLVGKWIVLEDENNRCLSVSVGTGEITGRAFGELVGVDAAGERIAVENGAGDVKIYALPDMREKAHFQFPSEVRMTRFFPAKDLLVALTDDQQFFRITLPR
jgi:WD40 repeat protein